MSAAEPENRHQKDIGLYVKSDISEFISFKHKDAISSFLISRPIHIPR